MATISIRRTSKVPWHNPLLYITARSENETWAPSQGLVRERLRSAKSLFRRDLKAHYGCVNAIEFSNDGVFIVSGNYIFIFFWIIV